MTARTALDSYSVNIVMLYHIANCCFGMQRLNLFFSAQEEQGGDG